MFGSVEETSFSIPWDRGIQWATEMLPLKGGGGWARGSTAHSFNCTTSVCRMRLADTLVFHFLSCNSRACIYSFNVTDQHFYHAMLCIARTMLSQDVRLSVRPSVCLSHNGILLKLFHFGQPRHSSFSTPNVMQYSDGHFLDGCVECRW